MNPIVPGCDGEFSVFHPEQACCRYAVVFRVDFDVSAGQRYGVFCGDPLIRRCDLNGSARNFKHPRNAARGDSVISGFQRQCAIQDSDVVFRIDAVSRGGDRQCAGFPIQFALQSREGDAVVSGFQLQLRLHDTEVVVDVKSIRRSIHGDGPAGEDELVIADNSALFRCRHGQAAASVDRQIVPGEDRAVHARRPVLL